MAMPHLHRFGGVRPSSQQVPHCLIVDLQHAHAAASSKHDLLVHKVIKDAQHADTQVLLESARPLMLLLNQQNTTLKFGQASSQKAA